MIKLIILMLLALFIRCFFFKVVPCIVHPFILSHKEISIARGVYHLFKRPLFIVVFAGLLFGVMISL